MCYVFHLANRQFGFLTRETRANSAASMATSAQEITLKTSTQYSAYDHTKDTSNCIAMATVKAPLYEPQSRSAVDIVAVIDRSGSMAGVKLNLVKKTLLFVIDQCMFHCVYMLMVNQSAALTAP